MDPKFPDPCEDPDSMAVSSDNDSTSLVTGTMEDVPLLVDSAVTPDSYIEFSTTLVRTYNNSGSRYLLFYPEPAGRPKSKFGVPFTKLALERYSNVNFCQIQNSLAVKLHVSYIFLGREVIDSNFLTKMELAVLVSAMNYAKMYYFHTSLTAARILSQERLTAYGTYLQRKHHFEGQVSEKDRKHLKKKRSINTFCSHWGRIYFKSVFETLKMFGDNIHDAMIVGGQVPAGGTLIKPWEVGFHGIPSVEFDEDSFSSLAMSMYTKGALLAQDPGTQDHFSYDPEENEQILNCNNGVEWGLHFQNMLQGQQDRFAQLFDPAKYMTEREDTIRLPNGVIQHSADKFVDRETREGGLLKFYDAGFVINPEDPLSNECFLPNGPKSSWWLSLLMARTRFEETVDNPNQLAASIMQMATQENDVALLQGITEYLHLPQTHPNNYNDFENMLEVLDGYVANPPTQQGGFFDLTLLQMLQDWEPDDLGTDNGLTVETLLSMMRNTGQRAYNVWGTNGKAANIHTGKVELTAEILDQYQVGFPVGTIRLSFPRPIPDQGCIRGGQIYNPVQRTIIMIQVRQDMTELLNIPHLLLELLRPDQVGPRVVPYSETRLELKRLMERMKDLVSGITSKLQQMSSFGLRIELFMQYDRDSPADLERLVDHPCPSNIVDVYNVLDLRTFLYHGIVVKYKIIAQIVEYDSVNLDQFQRSDFANSLNADEITTLVMFSEQMLINVGIAHFQGNYIFQMQKQKAAVGDRLGAYCIPEGVCTDTGADAYERFGLPFTVNCSDYLTRAMNTQIHDPTFMLRGRRVPSHLIAEAETLRKFVFLPLLYVQAMEKIRCMLLQASDLNKTVYTPLDKVNYEYIACDLSQDDRGMLVSSLLQELCSVYDLCWYTLVSDEEKELRFQNVARPDFPRTLHQMESFLDQHSATYPHVVSLAHRNDGYRIKTDGKCPNCFWFFFVKPSQIFPGLASSP
jgi:hypothetical protein